MKRPAGVILYRGPSMLANKPIVVIATFKTKNDKTGNMVQTWILRSHIKPTDALTSGGDCSVCGDCPLRNAGCYVEVGQAPQMVWKAYKRGNYPVYNPADHNQWFRGRKLRIGSYGDPTAAPYSIWAPLVRLAAGHTGYTHQWRQKRFWRFRNLVMASTETNEGSALAKSRKWRVFQTLPQGFDVAQLPKGLVVCPASPEGGNRRQCETCLGCNGAKGNHKRVSFAIIAHGTKATVSQYTRAVVQLSTN